MPRLSAPRLPSALVATLLLSASLWAVTTRADSASDLHAQLKERWYTTEIVVFRYTTPTSSESLLFDGERVTAAEYGKPTLDVGPADEIATVLTPDATPEDAPEGAPEQTLEDIAEDLRPPLDAEPADALQDYGTSDDLGALVAQNMATWESQLRDRDGQWLETDQLTLIEQAEKLAANSSTEVLLHTGWTQAVPDRENGTPLKISGGDEFVNPHNGDRRAQLEGAVTVTLGRYLHVQPTLFYTPNFSPHYMAIDAESDWPAVDPASTTPESLQSTTGRVPEVRDLSGSFALGLDPLEHGATTANETESTLARTRVTNLEPDLPPYTRLEQSRRVRSGELHYIDHPEIGILVRVTPVAAPALLLEQFTLLQ